MPGYVNGVPHATSTDRIDLWPTTSRNLAQWVDENVPRNDDPRLSDARPPIGHAHSQIENGTAVARLNSAGGLQHLIDGQIITEFDSTGVMTRGQVQRIERGTKHVRFDAVGRLQYFDSATGTILFQVSPNGQVTIGSVPWDRITGAPPIPSGQIPDPVNMPGPLGPLFARLAHADTATVPLLFVGSSTTRRDYTKNVVSRIATTYPSGKAEYGTVYADTALTSHHTGPGVAGYNAGRGGNTAADYVDAPILANAALVQPVAIFHGIGSNDWANNVPPATYETNVRAAITALDAEVTVPHVHILMQQQTRAGSRTYAWSDYTARMRAIADDLPNTVFVDLGPAIDTTDPLGADPFGYGAGDGVHLNSSGEEALAELMAHALGVPGSRPPVVDPSKHLHSSIGTSAGTFVLRFYENGQIQMQDLRDGVKTALAINSDGTLAVGTVPPARVPGLDAALYKSGLRNITDSTVVDSGRLLLQVHAGTVYVNFEDVRPNADGIVTLAALGALQPVAPLSVPVFRGTVITQSGSARRIDAHQDGRLRVHGVTEGDVLTGSVSWPFERPIPTTPPGSPA